MKSSHHLLHDRASKGHGSIPGLMSQTDLHRSRCNHACKEVCDVNTGIDQYPYLLGRATDDSQISQLLQPVKSQD